MSEENATLTEALSNPQASKWLLHAFIVICGYTVSYSAIKIGAESVNSFLLAFLLAFTNFLCHSTNLIRLKVTKNLSFDLPRKNLVIGLAVGLCISGNNFFSSMMFEVNAPLSIAMPVLNTGIVFLSVLYGLGFLSERLRVSQIIGVFLAVIGIVLINV